MKQVLSHHPQRSNCLFALLIRPMKLLHLVLEHILVLRQEYLALPECHTRENDQDQPHDTDDGGHDGVNGIEALDIQCVAEDSCCGDPADYWRGRGVGRLELEVEVD